MNKKRFLHLGILLIFVLMLVSCSPKTKEEALPSFNTKVLSLKQDVFTTKYGNLYTTAKGKNFFKAGFEWGDLVLVSFLDQNLIMPVVPDFPYVEVGENAIIVMKDKKGKPSGKVFLAINTGDFTTTYNIATKTVNEDNSWYWTACEGVSFPLDIAFSMYKENGFINEYNTNNLISSDKRSDYPSLTDEQFANFRKVTTTGISNLYRTSNPVSATSTRKTYADEAIRNAGVTVVLNLEDFENEAKKRLGFSNTYYSTCNVKYVCIGMDIASSEFGNSLAEGLRFMSENKGTYAIHCEEGKDRAGIVCAILECLMGASSEEVTQDYMVSYFNYYGVRPNTEEYESIVKRTVVKQIEIMFNIEDFYKADLQKCAEEYLLRIGLTKEELTNLKSNLQL